MIPKEQIEKVVYSADIIDFIGERVDLKRAGVNYKARCPFHEEKTPSFVVSPSKQIYKCFGCGASGNVVNFMMNYDNLSYIEAVKFIAQKVGIELVDDGLYNASDSDEFDKKRDEYLRLMNQSSVYYYNNLLNELEEGENKVLIDYLQNRGLSRDICKIFKIGYAYSDWNNIKKDENFNRVDNNILNEIGLLKTKDGNRFYDTFRHRLMFPVFDITGNIIAYSARILDPNDIPKYLNSPETPIYKKNKVLFGFFQAKDFIRKSGTVIVVEGNVDQISLYKYGIKNTVALCGTAFTEEHAKVVKRHAKKIIIMFDGDAAGIKAAIRSAEITLSLDIDTSLVALPDGNDPDSYIIKYGKEKLLNLIENPLDIVNFSFHFTKHNIKTGDGRIQVAKDLISSVAKVNDKIKKDVYMSEIAEITQVNRGLLELEVSKEEQIFKTERKRFLTQKPEVKEKYSYRRENEMEFSIIYLMLSYENLSKKFLKELDESYFFNKDAQNLFSAIYQYEEEGEEVTMAKLLGKITNLTFKEFLIGYIAKSDMIYGVDDAIGDEKEIRPVRAFRENLIIIKTRKIKADICNLQKQIATLESPEEINNFLKRIQELKKASVDLNK